MDSVIAKPIGIPLRSSFFKKGTSDAIIDKTLSANADEKKRRRRQAFICSLCKYRGAIHLAKILGWKFRKVSMSNGNFKAFLKPYFVPNLAISLEDQKTYVMVQ